MSRILGMSMSIVMTLAWAGNAFGATQIPADRTVTAVHTYGSFGVMRFTPDFSNAEGCAGASSLVDNTVVIDFSVNKDAKLMYAAVLAAYATGKKVGFGVNTCSALFGGGVPKVYRVDISQ